MLGTATLEQHWKHKPSTRGWISKRRQQENKASQIFRKTTIFTPWYAYVRVRIKGLEIFIFQKIWHAFSCYLRFEIRPFALLPTKQPFDTHTTFWFTNQVNPFYATGLPLYPPYLCISGGNKCSFFRKFDMLCFHCYFRFEMSPFTVLPTKQPFDTDNNLSIY